MQETFYQIIKVYDAFTENNIFSILELIIPLLS